MMMNRVFFARFTHEKLQPTFFCRDHYREMKFSQNQTKRDLTMERTSAVI